jgi:serine/threonine-protein kinase RIO1
LLGSAGLLTKANRKTRHYMIQILVGKREMPLILTDEQRARIAENREKALRIREVKAAERRAQRALAEASVPLSEPQTSANNVQLPEGVGELVPQSNPSLPDQNPNNNGNVNHVQQNPSGAAQQVQMRQPATFLKMSSPPKMSFKVDLCLVSPSRFKVDFHH